MADKSAIEWTDATWPIVQGCDYVSPGCAHCYAVCQINRQAANPNPKVSLPVLGLVEDRGGELRWTGKVACREDRLGWPLKWRDPRMIFVPSLGDLFHKDVPDEFILKVFDVMRQCTWSGGQHCGQIKGSGHTFQVLTKRSERQRNFVSRLRWDGERLFLADPGSPFPPGSLHSMLQQIWLGVSVEDQKRTVRIDHLRDTPAAVRFLSIEPLLEDVGRLNLDGIHWVIVGGESGKNARALQIQWVESIIRQCREAGVACFVKQLGARPYSMTYRSPNPGRTYTIEEIRAGGDAAHEACQELGRHLDSVEHLHLLDKKGGAPEQWPPHLRVRQFPTGRITP